MTEDDYSEFETVVVPGVTETVTLEDRPDGRAANRKAADRSSRHGAHRAGAEITGRLSEIRHCQEVGIFAVTRIGLAGDGMNPVSGAVEDLQETRFEVPCQWIQLVESLDLHEERYLQCAVMPPESNEVPPLIVTPALVRKVQRHHKISSVPEAGDNDWPQ